MNDGYETTAEERDMWLRGLDGRADTESPYSYQTAKVLRDFARLESLATTRLIAIHGLEETVRAETDLLRECRKQVASIIDGYPTDWQGWLDELNRALATTTATPEPSRSEEPYIGIDKIEVFLRERADIEDLEATMYDAVAETPDMVAASDFHEQLAKTLTRQADELRDLAAGVAPSRSDLTPGERDTEQQRDTQHAR